MARSATRKMGADGSECKTTLALALCQTGSADEALAVLDEVGGAAPYLLSVRAVARASAATRGRGLAVRRGR